MPAEMFWWDNPVFNPDAIQRPRRTLNLAAWRQPPGEPAARWVTVTKAWIWSAGAWKKCYDTSPGALASIQVAPNPGAVPNGGAITMTATGYDIDGRVVGISNSQIVWAKDQGNGSLTPDLGNNCVFLSDGLYIGGLNIFATIGSIFGVAAVTID
jgi:hypothetical protein